MAANKAMITVGGKHARKNKDQNNDYLSVQDWPIVFATSRQEQDAMCTAKNMGISANSANSNDPLGLDPQRYLSSLSSEKVYEITMELQLIQRNRDGGYLYEKLLKVSPENLFCDPTYYKLQYTIEGTSALINVDVGNHEHIERAFQSFASNFKSRRLTRHILLRLMPCDSNLPLFNPLPIKRYKVSTNIMSLSLYLSCVSWKERIHATDIKTYI